MYIFFRLFPASCEINIQYYQDQEILMRRSFLLCTRYFKAIIASQDVSAILVNMFYIEVKTLLLKEMSNLSNHFSGVIYEHTLGNVTR